jgi:hypothetical protein
MTADRDNEDVSGLRGGVETGGRRWKNRPTGSNWGEFGDDDQSGRMNLITPERRLAGAKEIRDGLSFCLSLPLDFPGWDGEIIGRQPPRLMTQSLLNVPAYNFPWDKFQAGSKDIMSDDAVLLFTQYSTQWDSLAHWGQMFDLDDDGSLQKAYYNGFRGDHHIKGPKDTDDAPYAHSLGIENLAVHGAQGRGVLVDLTSPGHPAAPFGYDDLMRRLEAQKVDVRPGDFFLVWAGYDEVLLSMNRKPDAAILEETGASLNGRDERLLRWIDDSGIVAICCDNQGVETLYKDANPKGGSSNPIHELCIFKLGIHLGELWHLTELAHWLRAHDRNAFFLTAPPLRLPGAVGSPLTPIATV